NVIGKASRIDVQKRGRSKIPGSLRTLVEHRIERTVAGSAGQSIRADRRTQIPRRRPRAGGWRQRMDIEQILTRGYAVDPGSVIALTAAPVGRIATTDAR